MELKRRQKDTERKRRQREKKRLEEIVPMGFGVWPKIAASVEFETRGERETVDEVIILT